MTGQMIKTLSSDIEAFLKSMEEGGEMIRIGGEKKQKSREKSHIFALRKDDCYDKDGPIDSPD